MASTVGPDLMRALIGRRRLIAVVAWPAAVGALLGASVASGAELRLGDGQVATEQPQRNRLLWCKEPRGEPPVVPWAGRKRWYPEGRPTVGGAVHWPTAEFSLAPGPG